MVRLFVIMLMVCTEVYADSSSLNLGVPTSPQSYQSDRIRAGDLECSMAIGSSTNVEFGVVGIINQNDPFNTYSATGLDPTQFDYNQRMTDVGVYAKITIPIGAPKERLNCNTLYKLELEKKRLEVRKLQQELQNLKELKFEN